MTKLEKLSDWSDLSDGSDEEDPMVVGKHLPIFPDASGNECIQSVKQDASFAMEAVRRIRGGTTEEKTGK